MDRYNLTARIYPMILFYLPLSVILIVTVLDFQTYYHFGLPIGIAGLFAYFTAQLGRDAGKAKEEKLWLDWGGAPSTQLFRWLDTRIDQYSKSRIHSKMEQICPVGHAIDQNYEVSNCDKADEVYKFWTRYVIGKTRDVNKYPLIFKENIAYGFRRNLWGLKPYAILLILILMAFTYFYFVFTMAVWRPELLPNIFIVGELFLLIFLMFWIFKVTKKWVMLPAFAYAERLHETIDSL